MACHDTVSGKADLGSFGGVAPFPCLRREVIQRPGRCSEDDMESRIGRWHAGKIGYVVRREVEQMGKGVEVVDVVWSRPWIE